MYWKQRCELSGEAMPVDVPAGLPSNAFVLKMMRKADATLKKVHPRRAHMTPPGKTVCWMREECGETNSQ